MTVICFNEKGRPFWKRINTKEYLVQFQRAEFTQADLDWFRKPLTMKGA